MTETTQLSDREQEILKLVSTGASNKEIAEKLVISRNTVKVHLRNIFGKIGVGSRTEAAMYAVRQGLVQDQIALPEDEIDEIQLDSKTSRGKFGNLLFRSRFWWLAGGLILGLLITLIAFLLLSDFFSSNSTTGIDSGPVEEYRWQELAELPYPRYGLVSIASGDDVYTIGGISDSGTSDLVDKYSLASGNWNPVANLPTGISHAKAALIGGLIYVPGGLLDTEEPTDILQVYDPQNNEWTLKASLPTPLSGYALVSYEGDMYVFGGWDGVDYRNEVYVYSPEVDRWENRQFMEIPRTHAGAAVVGDKIFIIGGENGDGPLSATEIYRPAIERSGGNPWTTGNPLPQSRTRMGVQAIADIIYILGGESETSEPLSSLQYFPNQNLYITFDEPVEDTWVDFGISSSGGKLYVIGGLVGDRISASNLSFQAIYSLLFPVIQ